jgi:cobalt-zinc-cadmium efflux system outer membrane protein
MNFRIPSAVRPFRWFALCTGLAAADAVPPADALDRLVRSAVTSNPEVRLYESALDEARARRESAARPAPPELAGSAGSQQVRDTAGRFAGEGIAWSVGVSQTFEWPGRLGLRKSIADGDVALATLGLERFRAALAGKVRTSALGLADAEEKARATGEVAGRIRELREVLLQRDPAGVSPQLELRILDATELTLRRRSSAAALEAETARRDLRLLIGGTNSPEIPALSTSAGPLPPAPSAAELYGAALTNSFELRTRVAELGQQGLRVALSRNERGPAFTVTPQFREEPAGGRNQLFEVGVSFPLPLWQNQRPRIAAEAARLEQARTLVEIARRTLERDVATARSAYESRRIELGRWSPESVAEFGASAALADRHYRLGAVTVAVYVEMQRQYLDAVEALLDTRREAVAAAGEIEALTGVPVLRAARDINPAETTR